MWTKYAGKLVCFALGAAAGSLVTWRLVKGKYERIANEEIESVKETYSKRKVAEPAKKAEGQDDTEQDEGEDDTETYENVLHDNRYLSREESEGRRTGSKDEPYVIKPEDFGEYDGYEKISLTYYSDGVLTDMHFEIIDDPEEFLGPEFEKHIGDYEDDAVHIRNDRLRCDYEVLADPRTYAQLRKERPYLKEKR